MPFIITVQGLLYTADGLLWPILLDRFHFDPFWGSVAIASSGLATVGLLAYIHKNADGLGEKEVLVTVVLVLYSDQYILRPFMSEILNSIS